RPGRLGGRLLRVVTMIRNAGPFAKHRPHAAGRIDRVEEEVNTDRDRDQTHHFFASQTHQLSQVASIVFSGSAKNDAGLRILFSIFPSSGKINARYSLNCSSA